jgi:hypothetical protein
VRSNSLAALDLPEGMSWLLRHMWATTSISELCIHGRLGARRARHALHLVTMCAASLISLELDVGIGNCALLTAALRFCAKLQTLSIAFHGVIERRTASEGTALQLLLETALGHPSLLQLRGVNFKDHADELAARTQLPLEVLRGDNRTVLAYARDLRQGAASRACRCKLILVGPGAAGKTTLVHRLVAGAFEADFGYTDGLATRDWTVRRRCCTVTLRHCCRSVTLDGRAAADALFLFGQPKHHRRPSTMFHRCRCPRVPRPGCRPAPSSR